MLSGEVLKNHASRFNSLAMRLEKELRGLQPERLMKIIKDFIPEDYYPVEFKDFYGFAKKKEPAAVDIFDSLARIANSFRLALYPELELKQDGEELETLHLEESLISGLGGKNDPLGELEDLGDFPAIAFMD